MSLRNCESLSLKGFGNPPLYYFEIQDLKNPTALEPRAMKEKLAKKIICDTRLVFCLLERTNFWFKTDRERGALVTITTTQHNAKCNRNVSALSKQQLLSYHLFFCQLAFNTTEKIDPVSFHLCLFLTRVYVIVACANIII